MMRWIVGLSIRLQFLVIIFAAVLMLFGIIQLGDMPVNVLPEFDPPMVEIQTEALGLSAVEMEALITVPLEADLLNGVAWLDQIYSESVTGLSSILLVFEPGTDPIRARQMVQERLVETFALPNVSKPPTMLQPLSTSSRVMMVGLSSEELSLIDIGVLARWNIRPRLMGVPGVANVAIWGQREWQLQVQVDPQHLQETGVTLDQVIATTGEALWVSPLNYLESSTPGTAGWIDTPNQRLSIRHQMPISSPDDLVQVPVKGTAWHLGDVATVVEDHQPLIGDALLNDGPGLILVVEKFPGANTLEVTRGVEEAMQAMAPGLSGIEIDTEIFRPASYIETVVDNLSLELLVGALLAVAVLVALFYSWRTALISLVAIPLSIVTAVFVLYLRGATFNTMVLAGLMIALGAVIDDAIIDVENIARRLRQWRQEGGNKSPAKIIVDASLEMRSTLVFATLIILLPTLPYIFLPNLSQAFFEPLAISYILALLASLAVALVVTPAMSLLLLADAPLEQRDSPLVRQLRKGYHRLLTRTIRAPNRIFVIAGLVIVFGIAAFLFLRPSLLPSLKQTDLLIRWDGPPGTSRLEMNRIITQASRELQSLSGVRNVGAHVGRAITGDKVVTINSGELWISLDPAGDYEVTVAAVEEIVDGYPGLAHEVETYLPERIGQALGGVDQDLVVRVYGYDFDVLRSQAEEVRQLLAQVDGVVDPRVESLTERPEVEVEVDLIAAERYQITPGDVRRASATLLSGLQVGSLYEEQKVFDVVVWGVPGVRRTVTDIRELLIDTPRGGHVQLGEIADVRIVPTPVVIWRDAVSRFIDVRASVSGRSLGAVSADVEDGLRGIEFPLEYHARVLGVSAEQRAALQSMLSIAGVALIGSLLLMQAAYGSWSLALANMLALPMALAGGAWATLLSGSTLELGAIFGFITLLGIAVRNSMIMIAHFQHLEREGGEPFGQGLVLRGAEERLAPVFMTALTTGALLLPLLLGGDVAGNEVVRPIAVVILGGLVTSTLLNLFAVPALYLRFGFTPEAEAVVEGQPLQPGLTTSSD